MLTAFAVSQHQPSPSAAAQDASSNADLAHLSMTLNERLSPRFDPAITAYTIRMTQSNVISGYTYIQANPKESDATITVTSGGREYHAPTYTIPVKDFGVAQEVQIKVTAPDGVTTKTYTLTTQPLPTPTPTPIPTATPIPTNTPIPTDTPTPTPTATPDPLPLPLDLLLSVSGDGLQLTFTAVANRYYRYELYRIADDGKQSESVESGVASESPIAFSGLTQGFDYLVQIKTCQDALGSKCGDGVATSNRMQLAHPTATPTHTPTPDPNATATPHVTPTVTITPTLCEPAIAVGASAGSDRPRTDDTTAAVKYPKLGPDIGTLTQALNETIQIYKSALDKGLSAHEAYKKANLIHYYDYIIVPPDSKFSEHRIGGYILFHPSPELSLGFITDLLESFLTSQGVDKDVHDVFGDYEFIAFDTIEGYPVLGSVDLPFTLIGPLSELPQIKSVNVTWGVFRSHLNDTSLTDQMAREPVDAQVRNASSNKSNAAKWHGADVWHTSGYTGKGIKIGILDVDFHDFEKHQSTGTDDTKPLPKNVKAKCFSDLNDRTGSTKISDCVIGTDSHGSAVAEAVLSVAPEVEVYISNAMSVSQMKEALGWMEENNVRVINYSVSRSWEGAGDGSSWMSAGNSTPQTIDDVDNLYELIRYAASKGIVWVSAAGNKASGRGYYGDTSELDKQNVNDNWITFVDEAGAITSLKSNQIFRGSATTHQIMLRWKSSDPSDQTKLDMYLCGNRECDSADSEDFKYTVEESAEVSMLQGRPIESLTFMPKAADRNKPMYLRICWRSGSKPDWIQLMVHSTPKDPKPTFLMYANKHYSMLDPGEYDIPGMLSVGAAKADASTSSNTMANYVLENYSSRGPLPADANISDSYLLKPEIVGATDEHSVVYGESFDGTSQAAPHVAGLAALVKQRYPSYTPAQIADYLTDKALRQKPLSNDPGFGNFSAKVFNNSWGYGFAHLPNDLPKPTGKLVASATSVNVGESFTVYATGLNPKITPIKYRFAGPITAVDCSVSAASAGDPEIVPESPFSKFPFKACAAGKATVKLLRYGDSYEIATVTIQIIDPKITPSPTATPLPTASLTLSDSSIRVGETVDVTVDMASPANTRFKLRVLNLSENKCVAGQKAPDEYVTLSFATPKTFTFYGCWKGTAKVQLVATDQTALASRTPLSVFTPTPTHTHTPTATPLPKPSAKFTVTQRGEDVSSIHVGDWVLVRATDVKPAGTEVEFETSRHFDERRCPNEGLSDQALDDQTRDSLVDAFYGCDPGNAYIRLIRTVDDYEIDRKNIRITDPPTPTPTPIPTNTPTPTATPSPIPTPTPIPTATPRPKPTGSLTSTRYSIEVGDLIRITATYNVPGSTRPSIRYTSQLSPNCGGDSVQQQQDEDSDAIQGTRSQRLYGCTAGTATVRLVIGSTELDSINIRIRNRPTPTPIPTATPTPKPTATPKPAAVPPPTNLRYSVGTTWINFVWDAPAGYSKFKVSFNRSSSTITRNSYFASRLQRGTPYRFSVRTQADDGRLSSARSVTVETECGSPGTACAIGAVGTFPTSFGDGIHRVGVQIASGAYAIGTADNAETCEWERLSNLKGTADQVIESGTWSNGQRVTIKSSDAAFYTSGCGAWTQLAE